MNNVFFSIIVVSFNAENIIEKTISSVLKQSFDSYEIIVKDGGSSDNTLSKIPENEKIKVYSNKDGGIYFGMNEGISYANGKYVCFLNCGDYFENTEVLKNIFKTAEKNDNPAVVYGNYSRKGVVFRQAVKMTPFYLYRTPICHQTMFIKKEMFEKYGMYDTTFKICADWNHTLKCFMAGERFVYSDTLVCDYEGGGASETPEGKKIKREETGRLRENNYSASSRKLFDFYLKLSLRNFRQKLIKDSSPEWIRKLYRKAVNLINGR